MTGLKRHFSDEWRARISAALKASHNMTPEERVVAREARIAERKAAKRAARNTATQPARTWNDEESWTRPTWAKPKAASVRHEVGDIKFGSDRFVSCALGDFRATATTDEKLAVAFTAHVRKTGPRSGPVTRILPPDDEDAA